MFGDSGARASGCEGGGFLASCDADSECPSKMTGDGSVMLTDRQAFRTIHQTEEKRDPCGSRVLFLLGNLRRAQPRCGVSA